MQQPGARGTEPAPQRAWAAVRRHPAWTSLGVLALAIAVLLALWDWNWFKRPIERQVEARTGRDFEIRGNLDVDLGWTTTVTAGDVRFGNAAWSKQPDMAEAERVAIDILVKPLFSGRVRVPLVRLHRPIGTLLLLWPTLLNHHPFLFWDSYGYFTQGRDYWQVVAAFLGLGPVPPEAEAVLSRTVQRLCF